MDKRKLEMPTPEVNPTLCTGCGDCVEFCPSGAVALINGKATVIKAEACTYCTECETICPSGAIRCPFEIILVKQETPKT